MKPSWLRRLIAKLRVLRAGRLGDELVYMRTGIPPWCSPRIISIPLWTGCPPHRSQSGMKVDPGAVLLFGSEKLFGAVEVPKCAACLWLFVFRSVCLTALRGKFGAAFCAKEGFKVPKCAACLDFRSLTALRGQFSAAFCAKESCNVFCL